MPKKTINYRRAEFSLHRFSDKKSERIRGQALPGRSRRDSIGTTCTVWWNTGPKYFKLSFKERKNTINILILRSQGYNFDYLLGSFVQRRPDWFIHLCTVVNTERVLSLLHFSPLYMPNWAVNKRSAGQSFKACFGHCTEANVLSWGSDKVSVITSELQCFSHKTWVFTGWICEMENFPLANYVNA